MSQRTECVSRQRRPFRRTGGQGPPRSRTLRPTHRPTACHRPHRPRPCRRRPPAWRGPGRRQAGLDTESVSSSFPPSASIRSTPPFSPRRSNDPNAPRRPRPAPRGRRDPHARGWRRPCGKPGRGWYPDRVGARRRARRSARSPKGTVRPLAPSLEARPLAPTSIRPATSLGHGSRGSTSSGTRVASLRPRRWMPKPTSHTASSPAIRRSTMLPASSGSHATSSGPRSRGRRRSGRGSRPRRPRAVTARAHPRRRPLDADHGPLGRGVRPCPTTTADRSGETRSPWRSWPSEDPAVP